MFPAIGLAVAIAAAGPAQARPISVADSAGRSAVPLYFTAALNGHNEVTAEGKPGAGDLDGTARGIVQIEGSTLTFAFSWRGITAPTMAHIHAGGADVSGPVKVGLIMSTMPDSSTAAEGVVSVEDTNLVTAIRANPASFYLNLHTAAFPAGAVRGQLRAVRHGSDPLSLLGDRFDLQAFVNGSQEVPVSGGPAVGDPDGRAIGLVRASGGRVRYALAWTAIGTPQAGHIHLGTAGLNGDVQVPLFTRAVPDTVVAVAGTVAGLDHDVTSSIEANPAGFYVNLHTGEFPGGAVRGQLFAAGRLSRP
jgi:hypothetical protein